MTGNHTPPGACSSPTRRAPRDQDRAAGPHFQPDGVRLWLLPDHKNGADQPLDNPGEKSAGRSPGGRSGRFARMQVARLVKALRLAEAGIRRIEGGRDLFARDRRARPLSRVGVRKPAASSTERGPARCPTHPAEALTSAAPAG